MEIVPTSTSIMNKWLQSARPFVVMTHLNLLFSQQISKTL